MVNQIQNMPAQFVLTEEPGKIVRAMSAYGIPQDDICKVVGISPKTLRLAFRDELDNAAIVALTAFSDVRHDVFGKVASIWHAVT
jgi:hypothetical protein